MDTEALLQYLQLNPEQYRKLQNLDANYEQQMDELFASEQDRKSMWKAMRALVRDKESQIRACLNEEQQQRYSALRQQQQLQRKQSGDRHH
ncbi:MULTISPECIES: hypothetical protein [Aliagarivorans]|uniref:hypothetical protein n=1 Tax=Aliagarivorans TaxID=882379 RepID=UPI00041EF3E0|nr:MULTISPECIES: hypothetical protein [Aliagarivorans]